jgi:hypothetical protein
LSDEEHAGGEGENLILCASAAAAVEMNGGRHLRQSIFKKKSSRLLMMMVIINDTCPKLVRKYPSKFVEVVIERALIIWQKHCGINQ